MSGCTRLWDSTIFEYSTSFTFKQFPNLNMTSFFCGLICEGQSQNQLFSIKWIYIRVPRAETQLLLRILYMVWIKRPPVPLTGLVHWNGGASARTFWRLCIAVSGACTTLMYYFKKSQGTRSVTKAAWQLAFRNSGSHETASQANLRVVGNQTMLEDS